MVVGKRGGRKKFGAERGGKLEKAGFLACRMRAGGVRAIGQWASRLGFAVRKSKSTVLEEWAIGHFVFRSFGPSVRVSALFSFFFLKKK
jgi:hypothetical protein